MDIDRLIDGLARDVRPVPVHARLQRFAIGIVAGGVVTLAAIAAGLGFRADLATAVLGSTFWMKLAYSASLAIGATALVARLARPERGHLLRFWPAALPVVLLAALVVVEIKRAPSPDLLAMWLGATWKVCPWLVFALSAPIFAGCVWACRRLAPTRLRAAGGAAGFAAGAWAAMLYCLHCPETSALFVLTWYTAGVVLAAAVGALLGPTLLRW